ncbi:MAG: hypothetical protein ACRD9S_06560 [Pyrinomonadaceae bacterium]
MTNRKSFIRATLLTTVCGLLTLFAGENAYSQKSAVPLEEINFSDVIDEKTLNITISINSSDRENFLRDPAATLRPRNIAVPQSAEGPWREFVSAVQRLTGSESKPVRRRLTHGTRYSNVVLKAGYARGVAVTFVGDWAPDRTVRPASGAQSSNTNEWFITKPVVILRAQDMNVPASDERAWKQLADALKALQLAYAQPERKN